MKGLLKYAALALLPSTAFAQFSPWPPAVTWDDKRLSFTGNIAYASNHAFQQSEQRFRRKELGTRLVAKDRWDLFLYYEFGARRWFDATLTMQTRWLFDKDAGRLRIGQARVPFGFESLTNSRNRSFLEFGLPMQAFFQNRRVGVDWAMYRPGYLVEAGYYPRSDFDTRQHSRTKAARVAWVARHDGTNVLHVGASWSSEQMLRNLTAPLPPVRWQSRPEANLLPVRLIDTGPLADARHVRRYGAEGLWIRGPWSLQGEYLATHTSRRQSAAFYGHGYYAFASYVVTGESRPYNQGQVGNIIPEHAYGALEVLLRYSYIDLNHAAVNGGRARNLTLGLNWYLNKHWKLQANHIFVRASRHGQVTHGRVTGLHAQLHF
ncbi:OprO/OprP family phosphate-selective porin [Dyella sp.]|uniref:OprO/OprP family phosphate-selective porin n=1 Tax=Dyella sp. TaxID=1869338 RepID=UPI002ED5B97D